MNIIPNIIQKKLTVLGICFVLIALTSVGAVSNDAKGADQPSATLSITMASAVDPTTTVHSGIWHYFNISFNRSPGDVWLILKKNDTYRDDGTTDGSTQTTYYRWARTISGDWTGLYLEDNSKVHNNTPGMNLNRYVYINIDSCNVDGNTYSFFAGLDSQLSGSWIYSIYSEDNLIKKASINIERSNTGVSVQNVPMVAKVEPYTEMTVNVTSNAGQPMATIFRNLGNVPLTPLIDSLNYNKYFTYEFEDKILAPGESTKGYISMTSEEWPPGKIRVPYEVTGEGQEKIASADASSFIINPPGVGKELYIQIGHSSLLQQILLDGDIVFHYPETFTVYEYGEVSYTLYIYSKNDAEISFIVDITSGEPGISAGEIQELSTDGKDSLNLKTLTLGISAGEEKTIEINVKSKIGPPTVNVFNVNYDIRLEGDSWNEFYTAIAVLHPITNNVIEPGSSSGFMVFILIMVLLGSYMAFTILNNKREV